MRGKSQSSEKCERTEDTRWSEGAYSRIQIGVRKYEMFREPNSCI